MGGKVTDPALLGQLNGKSAPKGKKVTDPAVLEQLHGDSYLHPSDFGDVAPGDVTTVDEQGHIVPVNPMAQGAPAPETVPSAPMQVPSKAQQPDSEWSQPAIIPLQHNRKTGEWRWGDSALTKGAADAIMLPSDALSGKIPELDPGQGLGNLSPALIGRTLNFSTFAAGGSQIPRVAAAGPALAEGPTAARALGIPLTRGQTLGDLPMLTKEEALRQGSGGVPAQNVIRNFDAAQREKIVGFSDNLGQQLGKNPESMPDLVTQAVQDKYNFHKEQAAAFYDIAKDGNVVIKREMVDALPSIIDNTLKSLDNPVTVDARLTPGAKIAMDLIDEASNMGGALTPAAGEGAAATAKGSIDGVSLQGIEQLRKQIVGLGKGANDSDARALSAIKRALDDWSETAVDNMLISGDDAALEALKKARMASGEYLKISNPKPGDAAGAAVAKMQKGDATAEEVANWLYGADVASPTLNAPKVAQRIKDMTGEGSDAFNAVRVAAWERLTKDMGSGELRSNTMVAQRIEKFLNDKGDTLSKVLYSDDERAKMQQFADALKATVTPRDATNPSRSGWTLAKGVDATYRGIVGLLTGSVTGNPMVGLATTMSLPVFKNIGSRMVAKSAVRGVEEGLSPSVLGVPRPVALGTPLNTLKTGIIALDGRNLGANDNGLSPTYTPRQTKMSLGEWSKQQEAMGRMPA